MDAPQANIAILLTPGMGHLIPLTELARKLIHLHNITITFIIPDDGSPIKPHEALLQTLPDHTHSTIALPPPLLDDLPEGTIVEARIVHTMIRSIPSLRQVLTDLNESSTRRLSAFVFDLFGAIMLDVVKEIGIPSYLFFSSTAMVLSFCLYLPELDQSCTCEYRDLPQPLNLPGSVPVHGSDIMDPTQDRKSIHYQRAMEIYKKYSLADGILVNSSVDLEPGTLKALSDQHGSGIRPPVYPIGPLIRSGGSPDRYNNKGGAECLKWLDKQPRGSVLFVSFGSAGTLSREQLKELTLGLQRSEQRFLFVARRPHDKFCDGSHNVGHEENEMEYLCADFVETTVKERGFVLSKWAPQIEVLSHVAVGGFVTHCGWNSTLESLLGGVPLIAWPLRAEQKMNAVLLSEDWKVAVRVRENENGIVDSEQISRLARNLIQGEEGEVLRKRMRSLKEAAAKALGEDGSSTKCLANVVEKWMNNNND